MQRVIVHIDSLVLKGFRYEDRHGIAEGLQQELASLFADPGSVRRLVDQGDVPRLRAGGVTIGRDLTPPRVGAEMARSIPFTGQEMKP